MQVVDRIDLELEAIQREKEFLLNEDRIREAIRQKIHEHLGIVGLGKKPKEGEAEGGKAFKLTGTEQDKKLERPMGSSTIS